MVNKLSWGVFHIIQFVFAKTIYLKRNDQFIMGSIVMFWVQARKTDDTVIHDFWIRHLKL